METAWGLRTIEEERSDSQFDITIIGKEHYPNYNRIMLSNILQKKMTVEETIMNPYEWYEENNIPHRQRPSRDG